MPEQFQTPTNTVRASSTQLKNSGQSQNLKKILNEWPGESRSEPKRPFIIPTKHSSSQSSLDRSNSSNISLFTAKPFVNSSNTSFQRGNLREDINENKRRMPKSFIDDTTLINALKANYRFIYRINDGVGTVNTILQQVCEERGWREYQETLPGASNVTSYEKAMRSATGWNLWWSYSIYQFSPYKYLRQWQYTNHNPKGFQFCNKLYLTLYLRKMKLIHGDIFDFYPLSFIIPEDYLRLSLEHNKRASESTSITSHSNLLHPSDVPPPSETNHNESPVAASVIISKRLRTPLYPRKPPPYVPPPSDIRFCPVWISKPVAQSQGKGIYVTADLSAMILDKKSVVQEYICRPLLIETLKWDLRLYVCISAIDPLVIYLYHEGLCRFCTEEYKTSDLSQSYSHLTNASLNKLSPSYSGNSKWPLKRLRKYFKDNGIADWLMWQRIMAMVVLTVIGDSLRLGYSASNRNCFDLFGFDVMVDEDLKPWLLECNYSPGLGGDCEADEIVKRPMLHELFDLLGFPSKSSYDKTGSNVADTAQDDFISGDEYFLSKDHLTRHYFELLMDKLKKSNGENSIGGGKLSNKWDPAFACSPEARLMDAKSIYSQNLVVQYLRNQSQGKISNRVREQLISLAAKKLKNKLHATGAMNKISTQKNNVKYNKSHSLPKVDSATQYDCKDLCSKGSPLNPPAADASSSDSIFSGTGSVNKPRPKTAPSSTSCSSLGQTSQTTYISTASILGTLKKEFPHPDSEAFQKLKHYFDAGVDYPIDKKTGRFKACPALLTAKKDWFNPPKQEGGWIRLYPFDARTTKSPYKSSLTDIRQAVRSIESYLKTAEQIFTLNPHESDEFFRRKMKQFCRRDTEVWVPPLESWTSNHTYFSPPLVISESNPDCSVVMDAGSCTE